MKKVLFLAIGFLTFATSAHALPSFVTSRGAFGGTDFIDWAQLGPSSTTVITSPVNVTSNLGINAIASNPQDFIRFDQGLGWGGNFANGDALLFTNFGNGPMDIVFANPVSGAGAQIQADYFGNYTGYLNVYGSDGITLLANYTENGVSNYFGDNSAIFMGVRDTVPDIGKIEFSVISETGYNDFAINRLDLNPVPEPNAFALIGIGLAGIGLARSKFRRKKTD